MASLDLHSRTPDIEKHARLAFRGDCPTCRRVRLHGSLPAPELVPTRAKAALAAGMMLASLSAPPATALAQDAPATDPGAQILPPGDSGPATPGQSDRGGGQGDGSPGGEQSGAGAAQPGPPADASAASAPAPQPDAPQPAPAPASHSQSGTRGGDLGSSGAPAGHHEPSASSAAQSPAGAPDPQGSRSARSSPQVARPSAPASPPPPAASRGASASGPGSRSPHHAHGGTNTAPTAGHQHAQHRAAGEKRRNPGAPVHVVKEGESLWLIARHALGPHASDAQIAELVSDLWNRNAGRIATGNPNLIQPGQTLEMPA